MSHAIYDKLKQLAKDDNKSIKSSKRFWTITNIWYFASSGFFVLALIIAVVNYFLTEKCLVLNYASLISLGLGYLGMMLTPVVAFIFNFQTIKNFFQNPLGIVINNAESAHKLDKKIYQAFITSPIDELKLVRMEVEAERKSFISRMTLTVGKIDKVGLVPGIIALMLMVPKIEGLNSDWLMSLAFVNFALFILGFFAKYQATKMERYVALIELAIEKLQEKSDEKQKSP